MFAMNLGDEFCLAGVPQLQSVRDHYSTKLRFKQSPETKAIVDAKCQ